MNSKNIVNHLNKKINKWIRTIDDKDLKEKLRKNIFVSGGAITSLLGDEEPNDYDIYVKDKDTTLALVNYYVLNNEDVMHKKRNKGYNITVDSEYDEISNCDRVIILRRNIDDEAVFASMYDNEEMNIGMISNTKKEEDEDKFTVRYISRNAITLTDKIQIVLRFIGSPDDIHKNFDFVHNTNYYDHAACTLHLKTEALLSLQTKELIYNGSLYPVCSMFRIRKFLKKGFTISAGQMLKIAMQISALDLSNINVLREQTVGVDSAYFNNFLDEWGRHKNFNPEKVDYNTLISIIDNFYNEVNEYER